MGMGKIILVLGILASICFFTVPCSAISLDDAVGNSLLISSNDVREITNLVEHSKDFIQSSINDLGSSASIDSLNLQDAFKVFSFTDENIVAGYEETGSLIELSSEEYIWFLPIDGDVNVVISRDPETGSWEIGGINNWPASLRKVSPNIQYHLAGLTQTVPYASVDSLNYVKNNMYHTEFVLFTNNGREYVIPYGTRQDLTGLSNGKVYEAEKVMATLAEHFSEFSSQEDGGGVGLAPPKQLLTVILLLLVGGLTAAYFLVKQRAVN